MYGKSFSLSFCCGAELADLVRIASRRLVIGFLALNVNTAIGQEILANTSPLTEAVAVEYALMRPSFQEAEDARLAVAESAVIQSRTLQNPVVSLAHERLDAPAGSARESSVVVSQTFDISGRRALRSEAAETRLQAVQFDTQSRQLALIYEVRRTFAEALYRQQLLDAHIGWLKRIESASTVVDRLANAGEASGYDSRRLAREVQAAQAKLHSIEADFSRFREVLASQIAKTILQSNILSGDLIPDPPPALDELIGSIERHPEIASMKAQEDAFERDRQVAERLKTPDITLSIGSNHVRESSFSDNGLILSLAVPIPLFDRGQAQEQRARAEAMTLQAERSLKLARLHGDLRGLWSQTTQLRQAAISFHDETLTASQELSHIADASYRAGEGSVLELLDAYRAELEAHTMKLDLALRARLARIELDALTGVAHHE